MQLSSSIIRGNYEVENEKKVISTLYKKEKESLEEIVEEQCNYEILSKDIIGKSRKNAEKIIVEAMEQAKTIEEEAYKNGYEQGLKNGIEDGNREVNERIIPEAIAKSEKMINEANDLLRKAHIDYSNYILEKSEEIKELSFLIAEKILNKAIDEKEYFIEMIEKALEFAKGEKTILIRCNEQKIDLIEENINKWKLIFGIKEGIFVIKDNITVNEVIVEKDTGEIRVGIETGMQKLKSEILGRE